MKLRPPTTRPLPPIPLSVLLTLLWVGLIRLLFLLVAVQARSERHGEVWLAALLGERILGRARLPTLIVAISLLLLLYLWLDFRTRPVRGWRVLIFLVSAALLVYLGWSVWYSWWNSLEVFTEPADMLMTARPAALHSAAA